MSWFLVISGLLMTLCGLLGSAHNPAYERIDMSAVMWAVVGVVVMACGVYLAGVKL